MVGDAVFDGGQPSVVAEGGLLLRPWERADAAVVAAAFTDPAIMRWHVRRADSVAEAAGWVDEWTAAWARRQAVNWAVAEGATAGAVLGRVSLTNLDRKSGNADVAYWAVPAARGRGIVPRAVRAAAGWAFGAGFHRLQLTHSVRNPASCRVAAKAGFAPESTQREAGLHADGWHDMHLHVLLRGR